MEISEGRIIIIANIPTLIHLILITALQRDSLRLREVKILVQGYSVREAEL